jgi:hypothetical protein
MRKKFCYILVIVTFLVNVSCVNRQFIKGRAELVSISDTTLNDSSIFVGHITRTELVSDSPYYIPTEIWIENTNYNTTVDSDGYYSLKTLPGTYTIKCQTKGNTWEQLIAEKKNVEITKNKKIKIDFYLGYTIE